MGRQLVFILFMFFSSGDFVVAQESTAPKDSTKVYKAIENYSKRNKITAVLYGMFFQPTTSNSLPQKGYMNPAQKPYSTFEGKVIRHIRIETLDPFGYSVLDTIPANQNFMVKAGNKMHIKSQKSTIRNLLLIHRNQLFDSLLLKESERLVRTQNYVNDVSFYVKAVSKNSDSVDVFIREQDKWSTIPGFSKSDSRYTFKLLEKNFTGMGHTFTNAYTLNTDGHDDFNTHYHVPNFRNTYVNGTLQYGKDEYRIFTKSIAVDRPFFSPFARWAGGINLSRQSRSDTIPPKDSTMFLHPYKFNSQDYWVGGATQMLKGNTENRRSTNVISTFRFYHIRYLEKPLETIDTLQIYADQKLYITSIGISTRKYVLDKFVFNYGITENVPIGRVYSITAGYQNRNDTGRMYLGARAAHGNYYPLGYLSTNIEYGTFLRNSKPQQGALAIGVIYFTGLLEIGKWKFRQFVKPQVTIGLDRFSYDSLTINEPYGIHGFRSNSVSGTHRILFTLQSQAYAPWNIIGFRFGPYTTYTLGMLGNTATGFNKSRVYSQFGFGVLIKNLNLVFSTFQISFAYYPSIPDRGDNIFKFNLYKANDFTLRDFEIGKPAPVVYQ